MASPNSLSSSIGGGGGASDSYAPRSVSSEISSSFSAGTPSSTPTAGAGKNPPANFEVIPVASVETASHASWVRLLGQGSDSFLRRSSSTSSSSLVTSDAFRPLLGLEELPDGILEAGSSRSFLLDVDGGERLLQTLSTKDVVMFYVYYCPIANDAGKAAAQWVQKEQRLYKKWQSGFCERVVKLEKKKMKMNDVSHKKVWAEEDPLLLSSVGSEKQPGFMGSFTRSFEESAAVGGVDGTARSHRILPPALGCDIRWSLDQQQAFRKKINGTLLPFLAFESFYGGGLSSNGIDGLRPLFYEDTHSKAVSGSVQFLFHPTGVASVRLQPVRSSSTLPVVSAASTARLGAGSGLALLDEGGVAPLGRSGGGEQENTSLLSSPSSMTSSVFPQSAVAREMKKLSRSPAPAAEAAGYTRCECDAYATTPSDPASIPTVCPRSLKVFGQLPVERTIGVHPPPAAAAATASSPAAATASPQQSPRETWVLASLFSCSSARHHACPLPLCVKNFCEHRLATKYIPVAATWLTSVLLPAVASALLAILEMSRDVVFSPSFTYGFRVSSVPVILLCTLYLLWTMMEELIGGNTVDTMY